MISAMRTFEKGSMALRALLLATMWAVSVSAAAQAQTPTTTPNAAKIPVVAASASPAIGEEVLDANGVVASVEFLENRTCTIRGCRSFIFDMRSGALINSDGQWTPAYAPTGRGGQVIRVLPFAASERPGPAPDDKALDTAPGIINVTRPTPAKPE